MTADEYVPDEEQVRAWCREGTGDYPDVMDEWLDRFLARVKRDAASEALDGLAEHIDWTASQFLGIRVGSQKAQDVRDYRDEHYPDGDAS